MTKKISDLAAATTPLAGTELVEIVQDGVSKKVASSALGTGGAVTREVLSADRTYYVRTDGSDANNGLTNTAGGAFLTIQKAVDVAAMLDLKLKNLTIQVADGTYAAGVVMRQLLSQGNFTIQGNSGTPANVVISVTSNQCFVNSAWADLTIKDLKMTTTTSGWALVCTNHSTITYTNVNFGACASGHVYVSSGGAVSSGGSYAISGAAPFHVQASLMGSLLASSGTVTITGTPAFSSAFVYASNIGAIYMGGVTFSGSATGKRYDVSLNATISSNGGGVNFFPGNAAGTTATGGQYA